jgi:hypothetical protein
VTGVRQVRLWFALHTAGASDVNIPRVVARVQLELHCFAKPMAVANDANIPRVASRVLRVRLCFAEPMAGASDVNIPRVVTRVRREQHGFAKHTAEACDVNIQTVVARVRHAAGCAVATAVKLCGASSLMLLKHSARGEEVGESAELRAMCQNFKG